VCASPAYLRRAGMPRSLADLSRHRCATFAGFAPAGEWTFGGDAPRRAPIRAVLRTNHIEVALDACVRGLGCGQFLGYQVAAELADGRLRRVLQEFEPRPLPIHVVYPHGRLLSSNVRAFVDLAVPGLRGGAAVSAPRGRAKARS
jgi:DNA-binding transcriptional LysR family regulator